VKLRLVLVVVACAIAARAACHDRAREPIRFATFNIEDFPKDERQVVGAFDEIARIGASFVAVQEIGDPALFARAATARLGDSWRFVAEPAGRADDHLLGVVFDAHAWELASTRTYDDTRVGGRNKATLEVRLRPRDGDGDAIVRVLVVHFRCCSEGRDTRVRQHAALDRILARIASSGERVVVLGDFNATADGDRGDVRATAARRGLAWATEPLACTAFWDRDDGCPRSRLDHVLTWAPPADVTAAGACATDGCDRTDRCPLYAEHVSDHCPVVVTMSP
jgi:endonuclease/exonuclease/phosphatase family metal-dependent hydrolase